MRIDIITLFPEYFDVPLATSIIGRAVKSELVTFHLHNLRHYAIDTYGTVDDTPYGGGPGMVLKVDVMKRALDGVRASNPDNPPYIILLTPQGKMLKQSVSQDLASKPWLVFICGHYEGFDERIRSYIDLELSIGPYVLSGGEPAALVTIDSVVRLIPGVTGHEESTIEESFSMQDSTGKPLIEYPHYTRPEEFEGKGVPDVLLSGHHAEIAKWRLAQAEERTNRHDMND
jgi:tRNA (guanine37-N1)-methyltransferase